MNEFWDVLTDRDLQELGPGFALCRDPGHGKAISTPDPAQAA